MKKSIKIAVFTIGALLLTTGNSWAANVVYSKVGVFSTPELFTDEFTVTSAGTYKATLIDFAFPVVMALSGINVIETSSLTSKGSLVAPGSFTFAAAPGDYTLSFFGFAGDYLGEKIGNFGIQISEVPVPAAYWLFGSALLGLIGVSRRRVLA